MQNSRNLEKTFHLIHWTNAIIEWNSIKRERTEAGVGSAALHKCARTEMCSIFWLNVPLGTAIFGALFGAERLPLSFLFSSLYFVYLCLFRVDSVDTSAYLIFSANRIGTLPWNGVSRIGTTGKKESATKAKHNREKKNATRTIRKSVEMSADLGGMVENLFASAHTPLRRTRAREVDCRRSERGAILNGEDGKRNVRARRAAEGEAQPKHR